MSWCYITVPPIHHCRKTKQSLHTATAAFTCLALLMIPASREPRVGRTLCRHAGRTSVEAFTLHITTSPAPPLALISRAFMPSSTSHSAVIYTPRSNIIWGLIKPQLYVVGHFLSAASFSAPVLMHCSRLMSAPTHCISDDTISAHRPGFTSNKRSSNLSSLKDHMSVKIKQRHAAIVVPPRICHWSSAAEGDRLDVSLHEVSRRVPSKTSETAAKRTMIRRLIKV